MAQAGRRLGPALAAGLLVSVLAGTFLTTIAVRVPELPLPSVMGAFLGGLVSGWILYGAVRRAALAGGIVGFLSLPLAIAIVGFLITAGIVPEPEAPPISEAELAFAAMLLLAFQTLAGAAGGAAMAAVRRGPAGQAPAPIAPSPTRELKRYCIQCGAPIPFEAKHCSACGAKQPE